MLQKQEFKERKRLTDVMFKVGFAQISRIEKFLYELEDYLKKEFPDESVDTKVPVDFAPDAPRFLLRHTRKKRFLEVSQVGVTLKMQITDDFSKNTDKGINYFRNKSEAIIKCIKDVIDPDFEEIATVFTFRYSMKEINPTEYTNYFSSKFFKLEPNLTPKTFNFRLVYVENEKYYINYGFDFYEDFKFMIGNKIIDKKLNFIRIRPTDCQEYKMTGNGLQIIIDINNKYHTMKKDLETTLIDIDKSVDEIFSMSMAKSMQLEDFLL